MKAGDLVWVDGTRYQAPAIVREICSGVVICDFGDMAIAYLENQVRIIATADEIKQRKKGRK